jgi:hypothetical protein
MDWVFALLSIAVAAVFIVAGWLAPRKGRSIAKCNTSA